MSELSTDISQWGNIDVQLHLSASAVPPGQRKRAAGVPGEAVSFECGMMCVGESLPKYSLTIVAAAAIQVLDAEALRLHAVVSTERWNPSGNITVEHWRTERDTGNDTAQTDVSELLTELRAAVKRTRAEFDKYRGK